MIVNKNVNIYRLPLAVLNTSSKTYGKCGQAWMIYWRCLSNCSETGRIYIKTVENNLNSFCPAIIKLWRAPKNLRYLHLTFQPEISTKDSLFARVVFSLKGHITLVIFSTSLLISLISSLHSGCVAEQRIFRHRRLIWHLWSQIQIKMPVIKQIK